MSRDPKTLCPELQEKYSEFSRRMDAESLPFILTCAARTQAEHDELWARGRSKPGPKVTWTRRSRHIGGRAFDIAMLKDGKADWDYRSYLRPGAIGEEIGLEWGGSWDKKDYPHFQLKDGET